MVAYSNVEMTPLSEFFVDLLRKIIYFKFQDDVIFFSFISFGTMTYLTEIFFFLFIKHSLSIPNHLSTLQFDLFTHF